MFSWLKSHAFSSLAANGSASFYFFDQRIHVINIMVKMI